MAGRRIIVDILGDASKFSDATKHATKQATDFSNVLMGVGVAIGQSFIQMAGQAAGAVVGFVKDGIGAASDLREAMALADQVFEDNTGTIVKWAEAAEDSLGLSQREALNTAATFGTAFKNVGMSLDETSAKAMDLSKLAVDLGSAFNASSEEAAVALRSGLLGESEPLRRFGVFLDEAKVKAKALAMGMKPVNGVFTDGAKVAARYALIMEQTADSQGMFGRDSGSLEDAQKKLNASMENLSATVGKMLLPHLVKLVDVLNRDVVPALKDAFEWFEENSGIIDTFATGVAVWAQGADYFVDQSNKAKNAATLFGESVAGLPPMIDRGAERISNSMATVREAYHVTADDGRRSVAELRQQWKDLAGYLLGKFNNDFDKAMDIREARQALTTAKTREDKVRAYQDLAALGAVSARDYDNWLATLREMSANAKGRVKANIDAAIADLRRLRRVANNPITQRFVMSYTGKALPGGDGLPGRASGGSASGLTWVGEQGPELVNLPRGSYVNNAQQSKQMAQGAGIVINVGGSIIGPSGIDELTNMIAYRLRLDGV